MIVYFCYEFFSIFHLDIFYYYVYFIQYTDE